MSLDEPRVEGLRAEVLGWWPEVRAERDRLPWRGTRDPWAVLVSESMLAQTQVARVATRFEALIDRFPTPLALAESELGEILRCWSGLGYNRRAAALHRAAREIVERFEGVVPDQLQDLLGLPGLGPYTARAVLAYAFDRSVGPVDANVARVLSRAIAGTPLSAISLQATADTLAAGHPGRDWNLALVDLGSLICRARTPRCAECPLRRTCAWRGSGGISEDPARRAALTSRPQARFIGSDRQGRGRLMRAACEGPIALSHIAEVAGWADDRERAERVAAALVIEGLLARDVDGTLRLG